MQTITVHRPEPTKARSESESVGPWSVDQVVELFETPFNDLLFRAQTVHRQHFDPNALQLSSLLSIKTGGCPEDCAYCPQSARHSAGMENQALLPLDTIGSGPHRPSQWRHTLLHGRGMAWSQAAGLGESNRNGEGREIPRAGDVRDPRHATRRSGGGAERGRARLLQP